MSPIPMSKSRIRRGEVEEIAAARIGKLMIMSRKKAADGDMELARRYVDLARRISMRTKTKIPKEYMYCRTCMAPMTPVTSRVRLRAHRVVVTCTECGGMKRIPYIREQKG
ncbi:MAG: hypothetical protein FWG58_03465 [Methanomassiliicoccaceae archaeon]|nr:hypothetical protein [Methanomassiliicoccaceae archaeon]